MNSREHDLQNLCIELRQFSRTAALTPDLDVMVPQGALSIISASIAMLGTELAMLRKEIDELKVTVGDGTHITWQ